MRTANSSASLFNARNMQGPKQVYGQLISSNTSIEMQIRRTNLQSSAQNYGNSDAKNLQSRNGYSSVLDHDESKARLDMTDHYYAASYKRLAQKSTEAGTRNHAQPATILAGAYSSAELLQFRRKKKEQGVESAFTNLTSALEKKNTSVLAEGYKRRNRLLPRLKGLPALLKKRKEQLQAAAEKRQEGNKSMQPVARPQPHLKEFRPSRNSLRRGPFKHPVEADNSMVSHASGFPELQQLAPFGDDESQETLNSMQALNPVSFQEVLRGSVNGI